jgi:hypothetical protein
MNTATVTLDIIDLPRSHWHLLPPTRWQVLAVAMSIMLSAIAFATFGYG